MGWPVIAVATQKSVGGANGDVMAGAIGGGLVLLWMHHRRTVAWRVPADVIGRPWWPVAAGYGR